MPEEKEDDVEVHKTALERYNETWNWYSIIRNYAGGDLRKFEEITKLNVITVLNDLAFLKETEDIKKLINKNNGRKI